MPWSNVPSGFKPGQFLGSEHQLSIFADITPLGLRRERHRARLIPLVTIVT